MSGTCRAGEIQKIQRPTYNLDKTLLIMENNLQILRPKELCELLNISIQTLYRWHSEGHMPIEKVRFGKAAVGYRLSDVEKWLADSQKAEKV